MPNRPSDQEQIAMINSKVGKNDTLIILGDVGDVECVKQLRGYKVLICGNHDVGATNYQRECPEWQFDQKDYSKEEAKGIVRQQCPGYKITVAEAIAFVNGKGITATWVVTADNQLFDEVYPGPLMIGEKIFLSHEPVNIPWAFNLHGHTHRASKNIEQNHYNCCADAIGYTPINFNQWLKQGYLAKIQTLHRQTINSATENKKSNRHGQKRLMK